MKTVERFEAVFRSWSGGTPYNFHHIGCSSKGDGPVNVCALCVTGYCPAPTQPWIPRSAVLRTQLCDATDPVWPGEDHATLDHLGLYGRAGCCQSPQGSSPNDEGTGLPPHLRARLALLPCHRPPAYHQIHTMYAPKAVRHHVHWQMRSQWNRGLGFG